MKTIYILIISIILLASCRKQDSSAPTIKITKPAYGATFNPGDTITIEGKFEDNEELGSYTVIVGDASKDSIPNFSFSENSSLSGEEYEYSSEIIIPSTVTDTSFYLHYNVKDVNENSRNLKHLINLN